MCIYTLTNIWKQDSVETTRNWSQHTRTRCTKVEISNVSSLLNLLYTITIGLTFENFYMTKRQPHSCKKSQKSAHYKIHCVKSLSSWLLRISSEQSPTRAIHSEILKSELTTKFAIWNNYRADFWEFLHSGGPTRARYSTRWRFPGCSIFRGRD